MKVHPTTYQSFLLRLWCEKEGADWRASLENIVTHECHNFANLYSLFNFLSEMSGETNIRIEIEELAVQRSGKT